MNQTLRNVEVSPKVWVAPTAEARGHWAQTEPVQAKFHQFGSAYEEFEQGPGNYTVAIVEMPNGAVQQVSLSEIRFID